MNFDFLESLTEEHELQLYQILEMLEVLNLRDIYCWDSIDRCNYRFTEQSLLLNDQDQVVAPTSRLITKFHQSLYARCLDKIEGACLRTQMYSRRLLAHRLFGMQGLIDVDDVNQIDLMKNQYA